MGFTKAEIINLILLFKVFPCCCWVDSDYEFPELIRFKEEGYTKIDENDNRKIVLNEKGKDYLRKYIMQIAKDFISLLQKCGTKCPTDKVIDYFLKTYSLADEKVAEDICNYLCAVSNNFEYEIDKPCPERGQNYYQIRNH